MSAALSKSPQAREGEGFYREEKEVGSAEVNKEPMALHWLSLCQERREIFLLPVGLCYCHRTGERPLLVS